MDSDCLVKLAKAGAKEAVASAMQISIPSLVKKETVDEAIKKEFQDAYLIKENIERKVLSVVRRGKKGTVSFPGEKGEEEVVSLYLNGGFDAVASDDRRFLKKLEAAGIPYLTPAACIVYLSKSRRVSKSEALEIMERLMPFISKDEYAVSKFYLEEGQ